MPQPPIAAHARDLSDAEFVELDDLLHDTPAALEPCDSVMLDGYLCGVLVQPVLVDADHWLPHVFDVDGRPLPDDVDPAWRSRTESLVLRRHAALNRALADEGWFDPLILDMDADDFPGADAPTDSEPDPLSALSPVSRALAPWVAGFQLASLAFPALSELPDDEAMAAQARLYRHLPPQTDEEREIVDTLDREFPLTSLDDAVQDMIAAVADLYELTSTQRYRVETVRREEPKVGRNDPCPCGSGKKFKHCHGA